MLVNCITYKKISSGNKTIEQFLDYRFAYEDKKRSRSGKIEHPVDWGFIEAMERGFPESSGIAIGEGR